VPDECFFPAGRTRPGPRVHGARYGPLPDGARSDGGSSRRPRWDIDAGITERDQSWSPGRSSRLQLHRAVRQGAIDDLFGAQLLPARWPVDQVAHIRVRNAALDQV
jgi:hypothetical protein